MTIQDPNADEYEYFSDPPTFRRDSRAALMPTPESERVPFFADDDFRFLRLGTSG